MTLARYGSLPFQEQIAFFQAKNLVPTERWNDLTREQHDAGFMVAGAMKADLLADIHGALAKVHAEGKTFAWFQQNFEAIVAKHGWTGEDTQAGRAWRARVIYDTNLRTSYQAGRWAQIQAGEKERPCLLYKHSDAVVRPRKWHKSWNGLVVHADDPWVRTHYPPQGFGCMCEMFPLSARQLEKMGKNGPDTPPDNGTYEWTDKKTGEVHTFPNGIDPFWDYAPGASRVDVIRAQIERKATGLPEAIRRDLLDDLSFIRASRTIREAEDVALSLGVKSVDYRNNLAVANEINAGISMLSKQGITVPDHVKVDDAHFAAWEARLGFSLQNMPAAFSFDRRSGETFLFCRPSDPYWSNPQVYSEEQNRIGFWSTGSRYHAVLHEIGHASHHHHSRSIYTGNLALSEDELIIARKVSA